MGRIRESLKEAINKFFGPSEPEKTFDEIAIADGVGAGARKELKATQNGVPNWKWRSEEPETDENSGRIAGLKRLKLKADNPLEQQNDSRTSEGQQPSNDDLVL